MNSMIHTPQFDPKRFLSLLALSVMTFVSCTTTAPSSDEQPTASRPVSAQEAPVPTPNKPSRVPKQDAPDTTTTTPQMSTSKDSAPIDRTRIIPIIKTRKWLYETQGSKDKPTVFFQDFNDELVVLYAVDSSNPLTFISPETFEQLGISRREIRPLAIANLQALLPRPVVRTGSHYSILTAGNKYESSLLLVDDLWKGLALDTELVIAIPARNIVLFTDSTNRKGTAAIRKLAQQYKKPSFTDMLFVYRNGQFMPLD